MRSHLRILVAGLAIVGITTYGAEAQVNIQSLGASARSAALGNAFVAVADNGDAVFANPAGLANIEGRTLTYTNVSLLYGGISGDDLGQHVTSLTQPLGRVTLGLGYERIGSDLMSESGIFVAAGLKLSRSLQLGVTVKQVGWSVDDFDKTGLDKVSGKSASSIGADVGLLWATPVENARLGVMLKNVLQPNAVCDCGGTVVDQTKKIKSGERDLPMDLAVGIGYRIENSLVSVQWATRDFGGDASENRLIVGGETAVAGDLMLRAGGSRIFEDDASGDLNAGIGYHWNKMLFDYGYHIPLDLTETNGSHRFSLAWQL